MAIHMHLSPSRFGCRCAVAAIALAMLVLPAVRAQQPSDGVFVIPSPTLVVKGGPNPNAAKLFAEFNVSDEVQKMFPAEGGFAARSDIAAPAGSPALSSLKILPVDYDYTEKEAPRIKKRFNEIFQ